MRFRVLRALYPSRNADVEEDPLLSFLSFFLSLQTTGAIGLLFLL